MKTACLKVPASWIEALQRASSSFNQSAFGASKQMVRSEWANDVNHQA